MTSACSIFTQDSVWSKMCGSPGTIPTYFGWKGWQSGREEGEKAVRAAGRFELGYLPLMVHGDMGPEADLSTYGQITARRAHVKGFAWRYWLSRTLKKCKAIYGFTLSICLRPTLPMGKLVEMKHTSKSAYPLLLSEKLFRGHTLCKPGEHVWTSWEASLQDEDAGACSHSSPVMALIKRPKGND